VDNVPPESGSPAASTIPSLFAEEYSTQMAARKTTLKTICGLATLLVAPLALGQTAQKPTACQGPQALEAKVHTQHDEQSYIELGNWFGEHHQFSCAEKIYSGGLKHYTQSAPLNYLLGLALYSEGRFEAALEPLLISVKLDGKQIKPYLLLGEALNRMGRLPDAAKAWQAALQIDPHSAIALDGMAKALISIHAYDEVIALLSPETADENLSLDLGVAIGGTGELDEAARVLGDAIKEYPDSARLVDALVTIYVHQLRYKDAVRVTGELAKRRPNDLEAQRIYLRALLLDSNQEISIPLAHKLVQRAPRDSDILFLCGAAERQAGDFVNARKHLELATAINPKHYNTHFDLGAVLAETHQYAEAEKQFRLAIELGDSEPEVRFQLSQALRKQGKTEEAAEQLSVYQSLVKQKSDNTLAAQKSTQAAEAAAKGDKKQAAALYREASDTLPKEAKLAYRWAMVLNDLEDYATERLALERAVQDDPAYPLAHNQLGYVYSKLGEPALAEEQFRQAVKVAPEYVPAWISLAASLAMQSKFPEAREAIENALKVEPENKDAQELRNSLPVPAH
jgi:tetratricopeptide (TPR) repeat protein